MKILIAPDSFKGTISAIDAAKAIADGWRKVRGNDEITIAPLADGGEGTLEAIAHIHGGTFMPLSVVGPDNRTVEARWLLLADGRAIVELASASGITHMQGLDAMKAHTFGFGELLKSAASHPLTKEIIATVGGSASTDAGVGALMALGYKLLDENGEAIALGGENLAMLKSVDASDAYLPACSVKVLTDVSNPLLGIKGAAHVFAPQKGANAVDIEVLENGLENFAAITSGDIGSAGAGAAGGTAFGLATLWGAKIESGATYLFDLLSIESEIKSADLIITGEGALDSQSWDGKVIGALADITERNSSRLWAIVGSDKSAQKNPQLNQVISLSNLAGSTDEAIAHPRHWLERAGEEAALLFQSEVAKN
jgi:glycerate kinase